MPTSPDPDPSTARAAVRRSRPTSPSSSPCGPDVDEYVENIKPYLDAGFDQVALVQIGGDHQESFIAWAEAELLPALRSL